MKCPRKPKEFWMDLLEQFEQSEMSQQAFAEKHDINLSTFRYWLYRDRRQRGSSATSMRFVEVQTFPETRDDVSLRLSLSGGLLLEFQSLPPTNYLASLLATLVKSSC